MTPTVLDSFALLAFFFGEPGAARVKEIIQEALAGKRHLYITASNWAELKYMLHRKRGAKAWPEARKFLVDLPLEVVSVDADLAEEAADLKIAGHLSLADAMAARLAQRLNAGLVTGDPEFKSLGNKVRLVWIC